jgi:hypothetical protein
VRIYPKAYARRWHSPIIGVAVSFTKSDKGVRAAHGVINIIWWQLFVTVTSETA